MHAISSYRGFSTLIHNARVSFNERLYCLSGAILHAVHLTTNTATARCKHTERTDNNTLRR